MKVLVTGAAGFIGSHLAERLLAQGETVVGLDNFDPYYPRAQKERNLETARANARYRFLEGDFTRRDLLDELLPRERFDVVVHLAARAGVRPSLKDPLAYEHCNVTGVLTLLEALRAHGPLRLVAASSSSVYGNTTPPPFREDAACDAPQSVYAATKRAGEILVRTYVRLYGFQAILVRPFTVYGPRQRPDMAIGPFARRILLGQPLTLYGDGASTRDYTFVSDVVEGLLSALRFPVPQGTYNLAGGRPIPLRQLLSLIEAAVGKKAVVEHAPWQAGDADHTCADLTLARRDLGYQPQVSLEAGIGRTVAWLREELARNGRDGP